MITENMLLACSETGAIAGLSHVILRVLMFRRGPNLRDSAYVRGSLHGS